MLLLTSMDYKARHWLLQRGTSLTKEVVSSTYASFSKNWNSGSVWTITLRHGTSLKRPELNWRSLFQRHSNQATYYSALPSAFSKMFDIELCPLPFSMEEMFGFISCRFSGYPASVQEQALLWLHVSSRHTHSQTLPRVRLTACGSVHGACELNRLS